MHAPLPHHQSHRTVPPCKTDAPENPAKPGESAGTNTDLEGNPPYWSNPAGHRNRPSVGSSKPGAQQREPAIVPSFQVSKGAANQSGCHDSGAAAKSFKVFDDAARRHDAWTKEMVSLSIRRESSQPLFV
jgi:hypothetical protein